MTTIILLLSLTTGIGFYWFSSRDISHYIQRTLFPNLQQQVVYVILDINQHNDTDYIHALAQRLNMDIAIISPGKFWSTSDSLKKQTIKRINRVIDNRPWKNIPRKQKENFLSKIFDNDNKQILRHKDHELIPWRDLAQNHKELSGGKFFSVFLDDHHGISYQKDDKQIVIIYRSELTPFSGINYLKLVIWLVILTAIAFVVLRRIMRPLKLLRKGVQALEQGKFDTTIKQKKGNDEFAQLIQSFNKMTKSVREHIQQKEQLLFDMSHELRSPLARIKVAMEFLPKSRAKTMIDEDIHEQELIIEELLETARLKNQTVLLNGELTNIIGLIQDTVAKRNFSQIRFEHQETEIMIHINRTQITRVINNLIDNAVKYSHKDEAIEIHCWHNKNEVGVGIADHGSGIADEDRERIFEPFYRLDSSRTKATGGYGLGLSLCQRIIEVHGGKIYVDPNYTNGLKIIFTLPL